MRINRENFDPVKFHKVDLRDSRGWLKNICLYWDNVSGEVSSIVLGTQREEIYSGRKKRAQKEAKGVFGTDYNKFVWEEEFLVGMHFSEIFVTGLESRFTYLDRGGNLRVYKLKNHVRVGERVGGEISSLLRKAKWRDKEDIDAAIEVFVVI